MAPNASGRWSKCRRDRPTHHKPGATRKQQARWDKATASLQPGQTVVLFTNNALACVLTEHIQPLDESKLRRKAVIPGM